MAHPDPRSGPAPVGAAASHAGEPTLPEPSWAPILLAAGIGSIYVTFLQREAYGGAPILLALAFFFGTLFFWVHQDVLWFRRNISTGYRNPFHGTAYFIATEVMFFGALFATYFYYKIAFEDAGGHWGPPEGVHFPLELITVNSVILFTSGFTMHWAHNGIKRGNQAVLRWGLLATIILGAVFLGVQVNEYRQLIGEGVKMFGEGSDLYGTTFYMLTGTHGAHVFVGLVFLCVALYRAVKTPFTPERHATIETSAVYWHFVDVVWVFVYVIIYLRVI